MARYQHVLAVLALAAAFVACGCATPPALADAGGGLHILLSNDDGVGAPGLRALHEVLRARGHRVSVVAPSVDRSGNSVSVTTQGSLHVREVAPGIRAVDGTPADCVRVALTVLLDEAPDLVVSGVNFGQNIGAGTVMSGTVGAAITAASFGVPAIAVSQAVDAQELAATARFFPDAAEFAAALIDALLRHEGRGLMPRFTVLNVNHPPRHRGEVAGVKLTRQGRSTLFELRYEPGEDGEIRVSFAPSSSLEPVADADTAALGAGYVTVTPLDGSWTASDEVFQGLRPVAEALEPLQRGPAAPAGAGR
jgi:5'/3'-nucleotidase SurE